MKPEINKLLRKIIREELSNLRERWTEDSPGDTLGKNIEYIFSDVLDSNNMKDNIQSWREYGELESGDVQMIRSYISNIKNLIKDNKNNLKVLDSAECTNYKETISDSSIWNDPSTFCLEVDKVLEAIKKSLNGKIRNNK